jgi:hypothetical protein
MFLNELEFISDKKDFCDSLNEINWRIEKLERMKQSLKQDRPIILRRFNFGGNFP